MPFQDGDIRYDLACGPGPDGRWRGWISVGVRADALRPLGLHPDQPTSTIISPSRPDWWYAAAARAVDHPPRPARVHRPARSRREDSHPSPR
ncbi:hypothetical protein [Streptomyces piniterrae]|uniref:hypothetical protein n=1 Tax=Streptomyces piniterrae TaxID=2571125 RepID=UPI001FE69C32|nr:hypothetical protein [Streptomyces piniterrae]